MKTIVSLALAGPHVHFLHCFLRWRRRKRKAYPSPKAPAFPESVAQRRAAYPAPAVQRMKAPSRSPAAMQRMDRILFAA